MENLPRDYLVETITADLKSYLSPLITFLGSLTLPKDVILQTRTGSLGTPIHYIKAMSETLLNLGDLDSFIPLSHEGEDEECSWSVISLDLTGMAINANELREVTLAFKKLKVVYVVSAFLVEKVEADGKNWVDDTERRATAGRVDEDGQRALRASGSSWDAGGTEDGVCERESVCVELQIILRSNKTMYTKEEMRSMEEIYEAKEITMQ
ncbi:uncharacterized protein BDR25DRAFT_316225 [Lindgomyces ingoldianus]|uniref:Uncharacterized protein n=1 Tax=Lindgomyces ingoldianus TaxID=673940 RepID=A0ACB6QPP1_9PLEO|nr:uncharacterized protein BDR25DRAFT_316225 [Lindgomyces ingoldianus]KAF2468080.1 hypothetical protein BDR25DRAFT_316225 [Lindgomyces ingoldianus]